MQHRSSQNIVRPRTTRFMSPTTTQRTPAWTRRPTWEFTYVIERTCPQHCAVPAPLTMQAPNTGADKKNALPEADSFFLWMHRLPDE